MAGRRCSSSRKLVRTMTRVPGTRCRSARIAATPSSSGMTRSIRTTSGCSSAARASPSAPSPASPAISIPSCRSRKLRKPSRTTAWSSTIRTRIGSGMRGLEVYRRPRALCGADLEPGAEALRPFLHRREPEPTRSHLGRVGIETDAVVFDVEDEPSVVGTQPHDDVRCMRMAHRVLQCFLRNPEDILVAAEIALELEVAVELDLRRLEASQHVDVLPECAAEPVTFQIGRPQLEDQG